MKKLPNTFLTIGLFLFCVLILMLSIRGIAGNPDSYNLNTNFWKEDGPFELSPERGRFALVYSLIEDNSFYFSLDIARFAMPDLGYKNGHFVSLFAPGVSFLVIPGYIIGRFFEAGQVGTFAVIALFALFNAFLIRKIAIALGINPYAASLGALVFLFATPAFAYGVSLYQHHVSTFLILVSIYMLLSFKSVWSSVVIWFLFAMSIPIDYPNLFLMLPIAIAAFLKNFSVEEIAHRIRFKIKFAGFLAIFAVVLPLLFFMWFNASSYGNPFQFSGTVQGVRGLDESGNPIAPKSSGKPKNAIAFFQTRNLLNGFYIHFVSSDRSILWFTPVIFISIVGIYLFYKNKSGAILSLLLGVVGMNVLLYSMWGDPWGGYAFGSRYLIPSYAILSIFIAFALSSFRKNIFFAGLFFVLFSYSVCINTLGAITSSSNPPKTEVLALEAQSGKEEKYTYQRNYDRLLANQSKSFFFQAFAKNYVSAMQYFALLSWLIIMMGFSFVLILFLQKERNKVNGD